MGLWGWLPFAGFLPVFWALLAGLSVGVLVSLWSRPPSLELTTRAFEDPAP